MPTTPLGCPAAASTGGKVGRTLGARAACPGQGLLEGGTTSPSAAADPTPVGAWSSTGGLFVCVVYVRMVRLYYYGCVVVWLCGWLIVWFVDCVVGVDLDPGGIRPCQEGSLPFDGLNRTLFLV